MLKRIGIILVAISLSSCSLLSPVASEQSLYEINMAPHHVVKSHKRAGTLLVMSPKTSAIYNTTDMAYSTHPHEVAYFAKNVWAARPAEMLKPLIINTLQRTHRFNAVISSEFVGDHSYVLSTQILELEQVFAPGCKHSDVHLAVRAELVRSTNGINQVVATKNFVIIEPAPQNSPYGGVIAANHATAKMLKKLARFCVRKS